MLSYNEITPRKYILLDGAPYEVLSSHVFRKQQRKPVNQTKLRNLLTGNVTEKSFHQAETIEEAEINTRPVLYLYTNRGEYWFCEVNDKSKRFELPEDLIGEQKKFLKPNSEVSVTLFDEKIIGVSLPIKINFKVTEAAPAVRGNTAQGATKDITIETGATLRGVPLFINEGDIISVNTQTGEYVERMEKN
jgi:elongation factor P